MEHARKMVLVDPQLLDTLRSAPPPPTDTIGKKVQALDDEMISIIDIKDLDDRAKVTLYKQVLQRYVLSDKHVKEPVRVVAVNETMPTAAAAVVVVAAAAEVGDGAVAPISGIEADVVDTVPKTMQAKTRRLMERLKRNIAWTARGELFDEGVQVAGINVVSSIGMQMTKQIRPPCARLTSVSGSARSLLGRLSAPGGDP